MARFPQISQPELPDVNEKLNIPVGCKLDIQKRLLACILLSTNTVSTMARFPQIFWSGLPDVNYEQNSYFNFAYLVLIPYLIRRPTFELSVNKY